MREKINSRSGKRRIKMERIENDYAYISVSCVQLMHNCKLKVKVEYALCAMR